MDDMKTDPELEAYLTPLAPGEEIAPEHRAWMDEQIRMTLDEKARNGTAGYTDFRVVMARFGLNAR